MQVLTKPVFSVILKKQLQKSFTVLYLEDKDLYLWKMAVVCPYGAL